MVQGYIVADFCRFADHHAGAVINDEAAADVRARVNFDTSKNSPELRNQPPDEAQIMLP